VINNSNIFSANAFWTLRLIATFATLTVLPITASSQVHADEGRIQITFFKAGDGSGSGYLFFQAHKYGLSLAARKSEECGSQQLI
jgi:hypothetical protein